ncbi:MAG: helix-turn-helix transcriptional regulator [Clostridia bacterium]|nr:helix-turn-helix transcriptional regulator [Clostridia bacterium]
MDTTKMGTFLQQLRKEQGMTQELLGEKLHVSSKTISRWETGVYMPPVDMLLELSRIYGLSINELVAGERLSPETLPHAAEETLTAVLKEQEIFQMQERKAFWQKKWNKDHRSTMILLALFLLIAYLLGTIFDLDWLSLSTVIAAVLTSLYLTNRRASYIEHHLYDDKLEH